MIRGSGEPLSQQRALPVRAAARFFCMGREIYMDLLFVFNAVLLGFALAMDAFSVSLANGLSAPRMKAGGIFAIAGTFAFFQWFMPMLGWVCVYYFVAAFSAVRPFIPYVALGLLLFIGGRMIAEGVRSRRAKGEEGKEEKPEKVLIFSIL